MNIRKAGKGLERISRTMWLFLLLRSMDFLVDFLAWHQNKSHVVLTNSFKFFTCLPYIHGTTDKIQHVLNDVGVRVGCNEAVCYYWKVSPIPQGPFRRQ